MNEVASLVISAFVHVPSGDAVFQPCKVPTYVAHNQHEPLASAATAFEMPAHPGETFFRGWATTRDGSYATHVNEFGDLHVFPLRTSRSTPQYVHPDINFEGLGDFAVIWGLPGGCYAAALRGLYQIGVNVSHTEHGYTAVAPTGYGNPDDKDPILQSMKTCGILRKLTLSDATDMLKPWYVSEWLPG
jgi:hypothetical protein